MASNKYTFIDLFSGAGGMSTGFEMAGFQPLLAIDNWQDSLDTYLYNHPDAKTLCADLSSIDIPKIAKQFNINHVDVIIGGPPCQGFSIAGKRIVDDIRNKLYKSFVAFVEYFSPSVFVMENVPNILSIGDGAVRESILSDFKKLGYNVEYKVLTASDYGVPQNRRRAIFVGQKEGNYSFPVSNVVSRVTAAQAISDLPEFSVPDGYEYPVPPQSEYQIWARKESRGLFNHEATEHSERTKEIISMVPDGGNYKDLPKELQETRKVHIAWTRLNSKKPSFTIDTGHRHHFHYSFNRIPTVRECARIQSFPDDYVFLNSRTSQYKQVGNAVPPLMARSIALNVKNSLEKNSGSQSADTVPPVFEDSPSSVLNVKEPIGQNNMYTVPPQFYYRIHHVRPRFKSDVESVLLFMAEECCKIPNGPYKEYSEAFNAAIRLYPGNERLTDKTINNWRTEISSLFGFYIEDKQLNYTQTGEMAKVLATHQDLMQFFKYFLFTFQYPGGHLKKEEVLDLIQHGIRFKPAKYLATVFVHGNEKLKGTGKQFSLSKAEATHCIFNDLRVTRDNRNPDEVVELVLENRKKKVEYDSAGDVIRYAGDILDYMVLANLLKENHGYYSLNGLEADAVSSFIIQDRWFTGYDRFYGKRVQLAELDGPKVDWFKYVNDNIDPEAFTTDIAEFIKAQYPEDEYSTLVKEKIQEIFAATDFRTKDIGDLGEALVIGHERMRITECGLVDSLHLIRKIPTALGVGYDVQSLEGTADMLKRYIEVKTTISRKKIQFFKVHLTPNEWGAASTIKEHYYIYRLMISSGEMYLYLLRDPVALYKTDKISMSPSNGVELSFGEDVCDKVKLKLWQQQ